MCHVESTGRPIDQSTLQEARISLAGGERMPAVLAAPAEQAGAPVLLIADMFGPSPFYTALAARMAAAGLRTLLVDYFFRLEPLEDHSAQAGFARRRSLDEAQTLQDLRAALAWLRRGPGFEGRVGVTGFCMGGTFALDLAAMEPGLVTVSYYGFPVPQSDLAFPPPAPMDLVDRMDGPILGMWGDQDEIVGIAHVQEFERRMRAAGKDYVQQLYPGLSHGFLAQAGFDGGDSGPDASWQSAISHLRRGLATP